MAKRRDITQKQFQKWLDDNGFSISLGYLGYHYNDLREGGGGGGGILSRPDVSRREIVAELLRSREWYRKMRESKAEGRS